jgi:hypothetical protein
MKKKVFINGIQVRPAKGSCPSCKAKEKEWCKPGCTLLDPANMGRE